MKKALIIGGATVATAVIGLAIVGVVQMYKINIDIQKNEEAFDKLDVVEKKCIEKYNKSMKNIKDKMNNFKNKFNKEDEDNGC